MHYEPSIRNVSGDRAVLFFYKLNVYISKFFLQCSKLLYLKLSVPKLFINKKYRKIILKNVLFIKIIFYIFLQVRIFLLIDFSSKEFLLQCISLLSS